MEKHFIGWTDSIAYFKEGEEVFEFINSMEEKVDRTNHYLHEVGQRIKKLKELENAKSTGEISEENEELKYLRTVVKADSISAIQNIHFLGDILGKALNIVLDLGYKPGERFYLGSLVNKKLKTKKRETYGNLIEKIEVLTFSKEWQLVLFISNREKHHACFDFKIHNNDYSLINTSKHAQETIIVRNEVKSFLLEIDLYESEKQVDDIVVGLKELKYLPVPDGIRDLKVKIINKIDRIGEAAYEIIEKEHEDI